MAGKGKVVKPINVREMYSFFGISPYKACYDLVYLCSNLHDKVNKWSKVKPIRYALINTLTKAQFAGTTADHANGIYYGMRCRLHDGDSPQDGTKGWAGLHKCNWEYLPPVPDTHYSRLSDFDGYNDDAVPNPKGSVGGVQTDDNAEVEMYYDMSENLPCNVICRTEGESNTFATERGVNLQEIAATGDIGEFYPCILISDIDANGEPTSPHYIRCLAEDKDNVTKLNKYQTLRNQSNVWFGNYVAETYKSAESLSTTGGLGISKACKKMVTLFVKKTINSLTQTENLTEWQDVTLQEIPVEGVYTIPGAVGIIVNYKRAYAQAMRFTSALAYALDGLIHVRIAIGWVKEDGNMPDRTFNYTFKAQLTNGANPVGGGQLTMSGQWAYPDEVDEGVQPFMQLDIETTMPVPLGSAEPIVIDIDWSVTSDKTGSRSLNSGNDSATYQP